MTMQTKVSLVAILMATSMSCAWAQEPAVTTAPETDHGQMDHSKMGHGTPSGSAPDTGHDMSTMDHGNSGMDHGSMQGGTPPPDARDPHAYSGDQDFGPIPPPRMGDTHLFHGLMIDRLERVRTRDSSSTAYELQGWFGRDYDRAVLKAEGDIDGGEFEHARTELLWGHAVAAYWDTQLGVRHDGGQVPSRTWLAFGIQGLAPYWFEVDATAYVGEQGHTAVRLAAEYELLLTQKLILQPRIEANFYGKRDAERELGSGLSDLVAGVRLRYEIRREIAPYVGVERSDKFAGTADFARADGHDTQETRVVAGLRFWF